MRRVSRGPASQPIVRRPHAPAGDVPFNDPAMPHAPRLAPLVLCTGLCFACGATGEPAPKSEAAKTPEAAAAAVDLPGRLVFLSEDGEPGPHGVSGAIVSTAPDGSDRKELLRGTGTGNSIYPAAPDPSGAHLAIITVDESASGHVEHLKLYAWTGGPLTTPVWQSPPASHVRNPSWGPGGKFVVFESSAASFRDLYRVELPAGTLVRLTDNAEGNFEPAVAPDGRSVAFVSSRHGNAEIFRMNADGSEQTRLTNFHLDDWSPTWSPDGKTLAFLSNREQMDRIFLMNPDGSDPRRFTDDRTKIDPDAPTGDEPHETEPVFAPDGKTIAFAVRTARQGLMLKVAPVAGGPAVALTDGKSADQSPVWSPDGTHLVFVSNRDAADLELYRVGRDGGPPVRVTTRPGADWLPRWTVR
jgi:TolB protein